MRTRHRTHQNGASLIVGLILLLVATLVVFAGVRGTQMQERMTSNLNNKAVSYMAAEAGASAFVDWYFDQIASNNTPGPTSEPPPPTTGIIAGGLGGFTIEIPDWDNLGAFLSIGEAFTSDGAASAESRLRVEIAGGLTPPDPEAAYQCFGEHCTTRTGSNANNRVYYDGRPWWPPSHKNGGDNQSCGGSACNGEPVILDDGTWKDGMPGIYLTGNTEDGAISTGNQSGDARPEQIQGDPPRRQTDGPAVGENTVEIWEEYVNNLLAQTRPPTLRTIDASQTNQLDSADMGAPGYNNGTVLHIQGSKEENVPDWQYDEVQIAGNTHGAGIMIIEGNVDLRSAVGTSTFEGIMILKDGARLSGGGGTFNVFGSVISLEGQRWVDDAVNFDIVDADVGGSFSLKFTEWENLNLPGSGWGQVVSWAEVMFTE